MTNVSEKLSTNLFPFRRYGTNLSTEVMAGVSTYLSLAYIFIVNPAILSTTGLDPSAVLFATVIVSGTATIIMGLWARLPFAVAPGLEMNGFFAYVVVGGMHMTWQQALGAVFISGLLCLIFTWLQVRQQIVDAMPHGLKRAIGTSVGVFVATIGLFLAHIVNFKSGKIDFATFSLSSLDGHLALILYTGLLLSYVLGLKKLRFPGGMLVAIIVGGVLCALWGINAPQPPRLSWSMLNATGKLDLSIVFNAAWLSSIVVFFVVDFLGGIGKIIGLTSNTNIQDQNGNVPNLREALFVDSGATVAGSLLGTSSLIAFVESSVGIQAGGRTGLVAVVCGVLMLASIIFTPLLRWIPAQAASGVLVYVGYLLLPWNAGGESGKLKGVSDTIITLAMAFLAFLTFSLDKSLALGFWAYFVKGWIVDKKPTYWLAGLAAVLTGTIVWQLTVSPTG